MTAIYVDGFHRIIYTIVLSRFYVAVSAFTEQMIISPACKYLYSFTGSRKHYKHLTMTAVLPTEHHQSRRIARSGNKYQPRVLLYIKKFNYIQFENALSIEKSATAPQRILPTNCDKFLEYLIYSTVIVTNLYTKPSSLLTLWTWKI